MYIISIRTAHYISAFVIPAIGTAIGIYVLMTTSYGEDLPRFFQIGAPLAIGVTAGCFNWFKLKPPKDPASYWR